MMVVNSKPLYQEVIDALNAKAKMEKMYKKISEMNKDYMLFQSGL